MKFDILEQGITLRHVSMTTGIGRGCTGATHTPGNMVQRVSIDGRSPGLK